MLPLNTTGINRAIGVKCIFTFPSDSSEKLQTIKKVPRKRSLREKKNRRVIRLSEVMTFNYEDTFFAPL